MNEDAFAVLEPIMARLLILIVVAGGLALWLAVAAVSAAIKLAGLLVMIVLVAAAWAWMRRSTRAP